MKISLDKKYRTRDGKEVVLLGVGGREPYSVYGYIGEETSPTCWRVDGRYVLSLGDEPEDLIEVEEEPEEKFPDMEVGDLVAIKDSIGEVSIYQLNYVLTEGASAYYVLADIMCGTPWTYLRRNKNAVWSGLSPDMVFKLPEVTQKHIKDQIEAIGETVQCALFKGESSSKSVLDVLP